MFIVLKHKFEDGEKCYLNSNPCISRTIFASQVFDLQIGHLASEGAVELDGEFALQISQSLSVCLKNSLVLNRMSLHLLKYV